MINTEPVIIGKVNSVSYLNGKISNKALIVGHIQAASSVKAVRVDVGEFYDRIDFYDGDYTVTPKAHEQIVLNTNGLCMKDNVVVLEVPYYETSNLQNGYTAYIGNEV